MVYLMYGMKCDICNASFKAHKADNGKTLKEGANLMCTPCWNRLE